YYYQYTATWPDRTKKSFKEPTSPVAVTAHPTWSTLFVPGPSVQWMADVAHGGTVADLAYDSPVDGAERDALVWTPPGYDPDRAEPYPVLYLNHGGGQNYGDWVEVARAPQILDNYSAQGGIVPMVVVMGNGNVPDFPTELLDADGEWLRQTGGEYGTTTGRPRRTGWYDAVVVRYASLVNGLTDLVVTKLDTLT
ncbi:esterase family protein, partial [Streptomyces sp. SID12501]|uniref:alpha/beta hydrolase n=1 Tax=Streptomyces sp. SID12501 TaxID=2706042 RepID=UPI0019423DEE